MLNDNVTELQLEVLQLRQEILDKDTELKRLRVESSFAYNQIEELNKLVSHIHEVTK